MPLRTPDFSDCSQPKKRCCENEGIIYVPGDECTEDTEEWNAKNCECDSALFGRLTIRYAWRSCDHSNFACGDDFFVGDSYLGDNVSEFTVSDHRFHGVSVNKKITKKYWTCADGPGNLVTEFFVSVYAEDLDNKGVIYEIGPTISAGTVPGGSYSCLNDIFRPHPAGCGGVATTWAQILGVTVTPRGGYTQGLYGDDLSIDFICS